jgi:long-chain acyl-CoA synthetase
MDSEGWFYLVDRQKDMMVASGFKVWSREVEDELYQPAAVGGATGRIGSPSTRSHGPDGTGTGRRRGH